MLVLMGVAVMMPMIVRVGCLMLMPMMMMRAVAVIVRVIRRRRGGLRPYRVQRVSKRAALHPQQPRPDQHDQGVADELDDPHRVAHHLRRRADQDRGNGDDHHGGDGLQQGRGERQYDAAPPGLFVGNEVGRDHRFTVARAGGVEDAVDE